MFKRFLGIHETLQVQLVSPFIPYITRKIWRDCGVRYLAWGSRDRFKVMSRTGVVGTWTGI